MKYPEARHFKQALTELLAKLDEDATLYGYGREPEYLEIFNSIAKLRKDLQEQCKPFEINDYMPFDKERLSEFYDFATKIGHADGLTMARQAKTAEERNFFAFVADMNLQREQKKAIENNWF